MADVNLASLNFELKIQDNGFDEQIKKIRAEAKSLNTEISNLLDIKRQTGLISKDEHQTRMRQIQEESAAAMATQRQKLQWSRETAKIAVDEAKGAAQVATAVEKTNNEKRKGLVIEQQIAAASTRAAEAEVNRAAATSRKAKADQDAARAEIQRQTASINHAAAEERKTTAINNRIASQQRLNSAMEREGTILRRNSRLFNDMKNVALAYFSFEGARRLVSNLVNVSAEFEKQRISLRAILQDANGAEKIFGQIKELAVKSPFQFKELVTYTKQLSAFSIPMNELYDTTKMLADVSAGLGVGMDRLVLAYGQIRSASFLRGQEVRQLTEAGIPILEELRKQFEEMGEAGLTAGDVFDKISRRQVTFQMVEKVFKNMTSEGGKFYQMQEVLADTLSGKISNLTDAYQIMFSEIGNKMDGFLKGSVDAIRSIAENYERVGRLLVNLVATYGAYRAALIAVKVAEEAMVQMSLAKLAGESIGKVRGLAAALQVLTQNTSAYAKISALVSSLNPYALAAAGVTVFAIKVSKLLKDTSELAKVQQSLTGVVADYNAEMTVEKSNLDYLFNRLRGLNVESKEYKGVKDEIINQYGSYLTDIDRENLALGNLTSVYDKLASSIKNASMEKAIAASRDKISEYQSGITKNVWDSFEKAIGDFGLSSSKGIGKQLRDYVSGAIDADQLSAEAIAIGEKIRNRVKWINRSRGFNLFGDGQRDMDIFGMRQALENMRTQGTRMTNEAREQIGFFEDAIYGVWKKPGEALEGWRADLQAIATEAEAAKSPLGITIDQATEMGEVFKQVSSAIEDTTQKMNMYRRAGETEDADAEERRLRFLQRMQARLGGPEATSTAGSTIAGDDVTAKSVANINAQIKAYKELKSTYESLVNLYGSEAARGMMADLFPQYGSMATADYDKAIGGLADELLDMSVYSDDAAEAWMNFQNALSSDNHDALIKSAEAAEKYREEIQKWIDEGYDLQGSGFSFDLSKIFRGLTTQNAGTDRTFAALKKSVDEQEAYYKAKIVGTEEEREKAWQSYKSEQYKIIDDIAAHEKENNRKVAEEKVNDLASKYVKDMYRTNEDGAIELTDWGDKSLEQIQRISEALRHLMTQDLQLPKSVIDEANRLGISLEDLKQAIQDMFSADYKNTVEEKIKRIGSIATNVSNLVSKMASSLSSLGENIEDDAVKSLGEMLDVVNQITAAVLECEPLMRYLASDMGDALDNWDALLKSGDLLTMVVKILGIGMEQIVKHVSKQYEKQKAITEAALEYKRTLDEIALSRYEGVLGVDDMGKLSEYYRQMSKATAEWARTVDSMDSYAGLTDYLLSTIGALGKDMRDLDLTQLKELQALMKRLNAEGYVGDGMLDELDDYIQKIESYEEAISDIFSRVADDIVDNLISAFDEVGDSVADIEDAFYDLGDVILRSVLRSMVLEGIVERYKNDFMKAVTEYALTDKTENDATALAAQLGNITSNLRQELEDSGSIFNAIIEAFRDAGLVDYNMSSEASNTLGNGIKSITEDTANLLASYVNAIRADVAAIRQAVVAGNTNTLPTPTLAEYLTQIQANTFNTAQNTADLLAELRSMMTVSDGPALRVFM